MPLMALENYQDYDAGGVCSPAWKGVMMCISGIRFFVVSCFVVFVYFKFSQLSAPEVAERGENVIREPPTVVDPDLGCIATTTPTKKRYMKKRAFITNV